jgi:N-methylhydantoinase A
MLKDGEHGELARAFHRRHEELYGHADASEPIEVVNFHVKVLGTTPKPEVRQAAAASTTAEPYDRRPVRLGGRWVTTNVYERGALEAGHVLRAPALVEQDDTTLFIPPGFAGEVDRWGGIVATLPLSHTIDSLGSGGHQKP